ncbi:MAG: hypothetical protein FWF79_06445 [Defluviitaleaceae bacterium]|nr:hypothetical protein [Defluviitaleaceae bacterium]
MNAMCLTANAFVELESNEAMGVTGGFFGKVLVVLGVIAVADQLLDGFSAARSGWNQAGEIITWR